MTPRRQVAVLVLVFVALAATILISYGIATFLLPSR